MFLKGPEYQLTNAFPVIGEELNVNLKHIEQEFNMYNEVEKLGSCKNTCNVNMGECNRIRTSAPSQINVCDNDTWVSQSNMGEFNRVRTYDQANTICEANKTAVKSPIKENLTNQSKYYNKLHCPKCFNIGECVLYRNHPQSCVIIEKLGDSSYVLMNMATKVQVDCYHVNDLKRYIICENGDVSSSKLSGDEEINFDKLEGLFINPLPVEELPQDAPRKVKALNSAPQLRGKRAKNNLSCDADLRMDHVNTSLSKASQEDRVVHDSQLTRPLEENNPHVADNPEGLMLKESLGRASSNPLKELSPAKVRGRPRKFKSGEEAKPVITSLANGEGSNAQADKSNSLGTFKDITRSGLHPLKLTDCSNKLSPFIGRKVNPLIKNSGNSLLETEPDAQSAAKVNSLNNQNNEKITSKTVVITQSEVKFNSFVHKNENPILKTAVISESSDSSNPLNTGTNINKNVSLQPRIITEAAST